MKDCTFSLKYADLHEYTRSRTTDFCINDDTQHAWMHVFLLLDDVELQRSMSNPGATPSRHVVKV